MDCTSVVMLCKPTSKSGAIGLPPLKDTGLARDELNELAHCHAGWETVRVHDEIGAYTLVIEGHVHLLPPSIGWDRRQQGD